MLSALSDDLPDRFLWERCTDSARSQLSFQQSVSTLIGKEQISAKYFSPFPFSFSFGLETKKVAADILLFPCWKATKDMWRDEANNFDRIPQVLFPFE